MAQPIISADSHLQILDERVLAHLPAKYHDAYQSVATPITPNSSPTKRENVWPAFGRSGEWDAVERLKDMDTDGVDAEVLYSDTAAGARFYKLPPDACLAVFQAYNSAALEFASVDPKRLMPVYLLPLHDIDAAITEVMRIANEGGKALQLPLYPTDAKLDAYYDPRYEPLWSAIEETGIPLSLHVVPPAGRGLGRDPTPARGVYQSVPPIFMAQPLSEWIVTGTFVRHPKLKVVLVESGLGWIAFMIDRLDRVSKRSRWTERGMELKELPSYYWHTNMAATFQDDPLGMHLRGWLGIDNLMWATDYPHADTTWPDSQQIIDEQLKDCTAEERRKVLYDNVKRVYNL
ncbi:MAG: amidohydrolase family protein [Acidimicrobiia bacterium]